MIISYLSNKPLKSSTLRDDLCDFNLNVVICGKKRIIDVENVIDEKEYDHFDKIPKLSNKLN